MNFHCASLLVIVFLLSLGVTKQADFQPICNLPTRKLQGVTALGEKVLLVIDDHLYRFPFTSDYVHNEGAMMALFSQPSSREYPSAPVHWTSHRDIKAVVDDLGGQNKALKTSLQTLTFFQTASGAVQFAYVCLLLPSATNTQERQYMVNVTGGHIIWMRPGSKPPVVHLSSGNDTRLGLTVHLRDDIQQGRAFFSLGPVVVDGRPKIQSSLSYLSAAIVKDSRVIFQPQYRKGELPLIDNTDAVFGFIFKEVVHLWDFKTKIVYLFKVPSSPNSLSRLAVNTKLRREPMSSYFICSRENWLQKLKAISPVKDFTDKKVAVTTDGDESEFLSWIIIAVLLAILLLLLVILIVVGIYHHYSTGDLQQGVRSFRKRRKHRKTPKGQPSPQRSPRKSPFQMRKRIHPKKISFSPQTSSVTSSQADSSVLVRRMLADRAPSSLTSMKSLPSDQVDGTGAATQKTLFKAKLLDFSEEAKKTKASSTVECISSGKKVVVPSAEKTVSKSMSEDHQSAVVNAPPKQSAKTRPSLTKKPITDRNSFVESKRD